MNTMSASARTRVDNRPHDVGEVEDIDVVHHHDDALDEEFDAERYHDGMAGLALFGLSHGDDGGQRTASIERHVNAGDVGEDPLQRRLYRRLAADAEDEQVVPETTLWNWPSLRMLRRLATNTFSVLR
jgi:hypothetical protein